MFSYSSFYCICFGMFPSLAKLFLFINMYFFIDQIIDWNLFLCTLFSYYLQEMSLMMIYADKVFPNRNSIQSLYSPPLVLTINTYFKQDNDSSARKCP